MDSTEQDLINAIRESLKRDGHLGRVKAELRSAVMLVLNRNPADAGAPPLPEQTRLINELVREYLAWNGYAYAEHVLAAEAGQHAERLPRDCLAAKLDVMDDDRTAKVPLLYYVLAAFRNRDADENS